jgi:hypothetical protein
MASPSRRYRFGSALARLNPSDSRKPLMLSCHNFGACFRPYKAFSSFTCGVFFARVASSHACHGARRIKVRMLGYGCGAHCARAYLLLARLFLWFAYLSGSIIISLVRLSLWLALVVLPVVVRFEVARGTWGIVVRVNVARVLCPFFD